MSATTTQTITPWVLAAVLAECPAARAAFVARWPELLPTWPTLPVGTFFYFTTQHARDGYATYCVRTKTGYVWVTDDVPTLRDDRTTDQITVGRPAPTCAQCNGRHHSSDCDAA